MTRTVDSGRMNAIRRTAAIGATSSLLDDLANVALPNRQLVERLGNELGDAGGAHLPLSRTTCTSPRLPLSAIPRRGPTKIGCDFGRYVSQHREREVYAAVEALGG